MNEWTSISESDPPEYGYYIVTVLATIDGKPRKGIGYMMFDTIGWKYPSGQLTSANITHWMKLPEPADEK